MKKVLAGLMAFLMMFTGMTMLSVPALAAEGDLTVDVSAAPGELYAEGNVTLTIILTNHVTEALQNINLEAKCGASTDTETVLQIEGGQTATVTMENFTIPQDMLGQQVTVKVTSYDKVIPPDSALEPQTDQPSDTVTITKLTASPKLTITRSVDKKIVESGGIVTITYKVTNDGDVTLSNIVLSDMGTTVKNIGTLKPGKNSGNITKEFTITAEASSKPSAAYKVDVTGETGTATIASSVSIALAAPGLNVSLSIPSSTVQQGETVEVTCELSNLGNVELTDIKVTDNDGTPINSGLTLKAGSKTSISHIYTVTQSREIVFTATAKDIAGQTIVKSSQTLSITVPLDTEAIKNNLKLAVVPSSSQLSGPGAVSFTVTVTNGSDVTLYNIVVSESSLGEIGRAGELAPGSKNFEASTELDEQQSFVFTLVANDPEGNSYTVTTTPITILVGTATGTNNPQASPTASQPVPEGSGLGTLLILFLVLIVLIIAAAVVLIILVRQDKAAKKKQRSAIKGNPDQRIRREPELSVQPQKQISLGELDLKNDNANDKIYTPPVQQGDYAKRPIRHTYGGVQGRTEPNVSKADDDLGNMDAPVQPALPRVKDYSMPAGSVTTEKSAEEQAAIPPRYKKDVPRQGFGYPGFNDPVPAEGDATAIKPVRRVKGKTDMGDTQEMPPIRMRDKPSKKAQKDDHYNDFL
ncbi:MAG: DUF7507 domain-containing protein [Christensenellales bacterium]